MANQIDEKLKELRKKYPSEQSQLQITEDETSLRTLIKTKEFAKHELVEKIIEDTKERIRDINFLLAYDETLNEPENKDKRYAFFRTREVWQFVLDRFGIDENVVDGMIHNIEKSIDEELKA